MTRGNRADLVVVGGGVVGLGAAREAALLGLRVVVLERRRPAGEATWAAAGMLSPLSEATEDDAFLDFGLASFRLWPAWAREVEEASGRSVGYLASGKLRVALSRNEEERLRTRLQWARKRGLKARWIDAQGLRAEEARVSPSARGALLLDEDHSVDSRRLGEALHEAAVKAGAEVRSVHPVEEIRSRHGRVEGITLADGSRVDAPRVLVAAGAWSGSLRGLPRRLPVRPVRGQMLALRPADPLGSRLLESEEVYLVPREDGRVLVGATVEEAGFQAHLTAGGIGRLLAGALRLVPELEEAPLAELWCGFRPGTPDGLPILGPDPELEGLLLGTGHFRNGILLAPMTARILAALAAGAPVPSIPTPFLPERFRTPSDEA
jgi:glycine oxidase